jgi:beta-glucanase (GH16 family)
VRNAFIALTTATALTASTFALAGSPAQGQVAPTAARATQKVTLSITPAISQNGAGVANPAYAWVAGGVKVSPARKDRPVRIQRRTSDTSAWSTVTSGRTDGNGIYRFKADGASGSTQYQFRAVASGTSALPTTVSVPVSSASWKLAFDDQFSGSTLDANKWSYRQVGLRQAGRSKAESSPKSVSVGGGALHLQVRKNPKRAGYLYNGHIGSQGHFTYKYGVAAARIKFQQGRGQHGGFWTQPDAPLSRYGTSARTGAEIDAVEFFGKGYSQGGLAHFLYSYPRKGVTTKYGKVFPNAAQALRGKSDSWWSRYHVFSVDWTSSGYVFRIDGDITWTSSRAVSRVPQYLILSLLTSDWELPKLNRSALPSDMKVDWVRVWQR